jgi:hypothetical protein
VYREIFGQNYRHHREILEFNYRHYREEKPQIIVTIGKFPSGNKELFKEREGRTKKKPNTFGLILFHKYQ